MAYGMAHNSYVDGVSIAGKTGTAIDPGQSWTHGWFAGFAPAKAPKVVVVVYLPRGNGADAAHLAQIFSAVTKARFFRETNPRSVHLPNWFCLWGLSADFHHRGLRNSQGIFNLCRTGRYLQSVGFEQCDALSVHSAPEKTVGTSTTLKQVHGKLHFAEDSAGDSLPHARVEFRGAFRVHIEGSSEVEIATGRWIVDTTTTGLRILLTTSTEHYVAAVLNGEAAAEELARIAESDGGCGSYLRACERAIVTLPKGSIFATARIARRCDSVRHERTQKKRCERRRRNALVWAASSRSLCDTALWRRSRSRGERLAFTACVVLEHTSGSILSAAIFGEMARRHQHCGVGRRTSRAALEGSGAG